MTTAENSSFKATFRRLARSGGLAKHRELCNSLVKTEIKDLLSRNNVRTDKFDYQLKVNACLNYDELFITQRNIKAFIKAEQGKRPRYILPWNWARELGCGKRDAGLSHLWFVVWLFFTGAFKTARMLIWIVKNVKNFYKQDAERNQAYLFFAVIGNFKPRDMSESCPYVLENWLEQHLFNGDFSISHSNKNLIGHISDRHKYIENFLPPLSFLDTFLVLLRGFAVWAASFLSMLTGNWQSYFMLHEVVARQVFLRANPKSIQDFYLYPFQGTQSRPLWADVAEAKGASVIQLNYASYMLPEIKETAYDPFHYGASLWSAVIPFNKRVAHFIEKKLPQDTRIFRTQTLSYSDMPKMSLPKFDKQVISLFDISVLDQSKFIGINPINDYLHSQSEDPLDFHRKFFDDILYIAKRYDFIVAFKQKRLDNRLDCEYRRLVENFCHNDEVVHINPEISAYRLVDNSRFAVVQPFSSVGLYESSQADVCFYDPLIALKHNHKGALGTDLCIGFDALIQWFEMKLITE